MATKPRGRFGGVTGEDGRCVVHGLLRGTVLAGIDRAPLRSFDIPREGNRPIRFVARGGVPLAGRLVRADAGPVGERQVRIQNRDAQFHDSTATSVDGRFRFSRVPPGEVHIVVWGSEAKSREDAEEAKLDITVPEPIGIEDLQIRLPAEDGHIAGTVVDTAHAPVADALVLCQRGGGFRRDDTTTSDARGRNRSGWGVQDANRAA